MKGVPLFEIDRMDGTRAVSITKLYETGAWTVQRTNPDATMLPISNGCTDSRTTPRQLHTLLASAPWKISHPAHCASVSSTRVAYYAEGKLLFTDTECNADKLDDKSATALADIVKLVDNVTSPKPGLETSKGKP